MWKATHITLIVPQFVTSPPAGSEAKEQKAQGHDVDFLRAA